MITGEIRNKSYKPHLHSRMCVELYLHSPTTPYWRGAH